MLKQARWKALFITAVISLVVAGCRTQPESGTGGGQGTRTGTSSGTGTGGTSSGTKKRIAVIPKGTAHSFWLTVKAGADAAGVEEGVDIIWKGPAKENNATDQVDVVQAQITNQVDGIVLAATDANSLVRPVEEAMQKGIQVVTIDSGIAKDISVAYIATDNVEGGRRAADELAKLIGERGNVGLMPFLQGSVSSDEREKGFKEGIAKYPNIKIVATLYTQSDVNQAVDQTTNMLTANPDIKGIFAANEPNGVAAAQVLKQKGLSGKVKLVAFDSSKEEIDALKEGTIQALIVQNPYQMGYLGVKTVMKAIRKEPIDKKVVDSGLKVVTSANLTTPEIQTLLDPAAAAAKK